MPALLDAVGEVGAAHPLAGDRGEQDDHAVALAPHLLGERDADADRARRS